MNSRLNLTRPVAFFDIESTGINVLSDRIIEIAVTKVFPDGTSRTNVRRVNPGIPIPPESTEIHHITDADVANCPSFEEVAPRLFNYLNDCDFAGYNILTFDLPILQEEFHRVGLDFDYSKCAIIDVYQIFCKLFPRNLSAAYKFFCGKELEDAHSAGADTEATLEVLAAQLEKYPELPATADGLADYTKDKDALDAMKRFAWKNGEVIINFGKHKGEKLKDVAVNEPSFLHWIIKGEFTRDVKKIASDALYNRFPTPPEETENK